MIDSKLQMSLFDDNNDLNTIEKEKIENKSFFQTNDGIIFCSEEDFLNEDFSKPIFYYDDSEPRIIGIDPSREKTDPLYISICSAKEHSLKSLKEKYTEQFFLIQKINTDEIADIENNIIILEKLQDKIQTKNFIKNKKNTSDKNILEDILDDKKEHKNKFRM